MMTDPIETEYERLMYKQQVEDAIARLKAILEEYWFVEDDDDFSLPALVDAIERCIGSLAAEARRIPSLEYQLEIARNASVSWQQEQHRAQDQLDDYHSENPTQYDTYLLRLDLESARGDVKRLQHELTSLTNDFVLAHKAADASEDKWMTLAEENQRLQLGMQKKD